MGSSEAVRLNLKHMSPFSLTFAVRAFAAPTQTLSDGLA